MAREKFTNNKKKPNGKREYSDQEIEQILKADIETPEYINQCIEDTYACLGIKHGKEQKRMRKQYHWKIVVAALAVTVSLGVVGFAANKYMAVLKKEIRFNIHFRWIVQKRLMQFK